MGYYPYIQTCVHGHSWHAAFRSFDMVDTGLSACPECSCTRIGRSEDNGYSKTLQWEPEEITFEGVCKHIKVIESSS